jgi:hypothetical protein
VEKAEKSCKLQETIDMLRDGLVQRMKKQKMFAEKSSKYE